MNFKLEIECIILNVVSAYAQVRCEFEEKMNSDVS